MCLSHNPFFQVTSLIFIIKSWCQTEPKAGDVFFCPQHIKPEYLWPFTIFSRTSSNRLFCTVLPNTSESADVEIRHDLPGVFTGNRQNFLGEHLPSQTHWLNSIVARNGWSPECRGEFVSHRPMVRSSHTGPWERLAVSPGLVTTRSLGSGKLPGSG